MQCKNSKQSSAPLDLDGECRVAVSEEIFAVVHVFTNIFHFGLDLFELYI